MRVLRDRECEEVEREFEQLVKPVKAVFITQEWFCQYCGVTENLLQDLTELSKLFSFEAIDFVLDAERSRDYPHIDKVPAISIESEVGDCGIHFCGVPGGYLFTSLVKAICDVSRGTPDVSDETSELLSRLHRPHRIQVFATPTNLASSYAVHGAHRIAMASDKVHAEMVELMEFPQYTYRYKISDSPFTVIDELPGTVGVINEIDLALELLKAEGIAP